MPTRLQISVKQVRTAVNKVLARVVAVAPFNVPAGIPASAFKNKGDILVGTGSGTYTNKPVGNNDDTVVADSASSAGVKWQSKFSDAEGDPAEMGAPADGASSFAARRDHVHSPLFRTKTMPAVCEMFSLANGRFPFNSTAIGTGTLSELASIADHPGILRIVSPATINTGYAIHLANAAATALQVLLSAGDTFEFIFRCPTTTSLQARLGFLDSVSTAAVVDGALINITGAVLDGRTVSNSVSSTTGTNYTITANVWYRAKIVLSAGPRVDFYLYDMAGAQLWTDNLTTNIPTVAGRETSVAMLAYITAATAANLLDADWAAYYNLTPLTR